MGPVVSPGVSVRVPPSFDDLHVSIGEGGGEGAFDAF